MLKGIEQYKGKTIFHSLCDFAEGGRIATQASVEKQSSWLVQQRERLLKEWFGIEPGQPWHPERKYTIIAKCTIDSGKISRVSYLPCLNNEEGQTEILKHDKRGQQVFDYIDKITRGADLNARYEWEGDEVVIHAA